MDRIAIIGSGEMARHIAHFLIEDNQYEVVGFFNDYIEKGTIVNGYPILGKTEDILSIYNYGNFDKLINGIGYSHMKFRKEIFEILKPKIPFASFIHSSCYVDSTAKIGDGVVIFPFCLIYLDAIIEDNVFIQIQTCITDSVIKKNTMISGSVTIAGRTSIGACCNIGLGTMVINDIKVCDNVETGAGAVVVKDIIDEGVYVGVPARLLHSK